MFKVITVLIGCWLSVPSFVCSMELSFIEEKKNLPKLQNIKFVEGKAVQVPKPLKQLPVEIDPEIEKLLAFIPLERKAIENLLNNKHTYTKLRLKDKRINEVGAKALAFVLINNTILTSLDLSKNDLRHAGVEAIAQMLLLNSTLQCLNLSCVTLMAARRETSPGVEALAKVLHTNSTLKELHLTANHVGDKAAEALAEMLKKNSTLTALSLGNNISSTGEVALVEALEVNRTLTQLDRGRDGFILSLEVQVKKSLLRNQKELKASKPKEIIPLGKLEQSSVPPSSSKSEQIPDNSSLSSISPELVILCIEAGRKTPEVTREFAKTHLLPLFVEGKVSKGWRKRANWLSPYYIKAKEKGDNDTSKVLEGIFIEECNKLPLFEELLKEYIKNNNNAELAIGALTLNLL